VKVYRFKGEAFIAGVKDHDLDGVNVRVYDPEKTLAGCFKFRNQLGIEIVLAQSVFLGGNIMSKSS
jgi:hypothetical protein